MARLIKGFTVPRLRGSRVATKVIGTEPSTRLTVRSRWNGGPQAASVLLVARDSIDEITEKSAAHARANHEWENRSGRAEQSIMHRPAQLMPDRKVRGEFGSYGVPYFIWLEEGTTHARPFYTLRHAKDIYFPMLGSLLEQNMSKKGLTRVSGST